MSDESESIAINKIISQWQLFLIAIMFYSRIPVPKSLPHSEDLLNQSRAYFPAVGLLIGTICSLSFLLLNCVLPLNLSVAISIAIGVLITGAFHEDGFADSCDGLGGGWSKQQALKIMKDSRLGTFGSIGLLLLMTIKFLTLFETSKIDPALFCLVVIFSHTASRLLASSVIEFYSYVQDADISKIKPITNIKLTYQAWLISIGTLLFATILAVPNKHILFITLVLVFFCAGIVGWLFSQYCQKRIGGYTGDTLGATQQLCEITIYIGLLIASY